MAKVTSRQALVPWRPVSERPAVGAQVFALRVTPYIPDKMRADRCCITGGTVAYLRGDDDWYLNWEGHLWPAKEYQAWCHHAEFYPFIQVWNEKV